MSSFRLQNFAARPDAGPRLSPDEVEAIRAEAFREGFLAGEAAAAEAHLADQTRLTSELIEAISDARMTNEAARRHVAASLAPLAAAVVAALTPALAEAGLAAEVAARVEAALRTAPEARPRLRCAPELAPVIRGVLAERGLPASVEPNPAMPPREAILEWDQGYDRIDLDACAAEIREVVATHLEPEEARDAERRYG